MKNKLKCFFGFHKWVNLIKDIPVPKDKEIIYWTTIHKCSICSKKVEMAMGWIC